MDRIQEVCSQELEDCEETLVVAIDKRETWNVAGFMAGAGRNDALVTPHRHVPRRPSRGGMYAA
jgi:hypothetical protein